MNEDDDGTRVALLTEVNLQDIIMERKAQRKLKAEERRQVDLQRIREMKSATGIDPLEQFPKEIWEKIFNALNAEDRENTTQVHPLFSHLMEASKIGNIFLPQVLQLDTFHHCFEEPSELAKADFEFTKHLRWLSKISREYFDRWVDASFEKRMQKHDAHYTAYYNHVSFTFGKRKSHQRLTKILAAYGESKNPAKRFFSRGMSVFFTEDHISIPIPEETEEGREEFLQELRTTFRNNIDAILSLIGDQIFHFRFYITDLKMTPSSFAENWILFKRLVSLLPNLKWLEFSIGGKEGTNQAPKKTSKIAILRENPFPSMKSLERLTFHFDFYHQDLNACQMEMLGAVIVANPHIKHLDVVDGEDAEIQGLPAHQIKSLDQLTKLNFDHYNCIYLNLILIERIINVDWPLKSIHLSLNMEATTMPSLFHFLETFPTLEDVELDRLDEPSIGDTDSWGYLKLPNLSNIHLAVGDPLIDYDTNIHFFFSLQFLLHCEKLKTLSWSLYCFDDIRLRNNMKLHEILGKTIDFRAGLRVVYESNVWDVFSALESCTVTMLKNGYDNENVLLKSPLRCEHEYRRLAPGQRMPIAHFLKSHGCCQNDYGLHNCVCLLE